LVDTNKNILFYQKKTIKKKKTEEEVENINVSLFFIRFQCGASLLGNFVLYMYLGMHIMYIIITNPLLSITNK